MQTVGLGRRDQGGSTAKGWPKLGKAGLARGAAEFGDDDGNGGRSALGTVTYDGRAGGGVAPDGAATTWTLASSGRRCRTAWLGQKRQGIDTRNADENRAGDTTRVFAEEWGHTRVEETRQRENSWGARGSVGRMRETQVRTGAGERETVEAKEESTSRRRQVLGEK